MIPNKNQPTQLPPFLIDQIQVEELMDLAILEANRSLDHADIPVGALILDTTGSVVSKAHNQKTLNSNALCHAEMIAINKALESTNNTYLNDFTIVVSLEPCAMCAAAIVASRIRHLVFGAFDLKNGACGSLMNITDDPRLNHNLNIIRGILEQRCANLLTEFFDQKRS